MVKISKKEYETLKSLGERWIWIARDSGDDYIGQLFAYLEKPIKSYDVGCWRDYDGGGFSSTDSYLFQFIQWSDSEPYNIAELIRGYEWAQLNKKYPPVGESEETEVKSKQELIEKWESAIESAEFYGKGKEEEIIGYMRVFVSDLRQLDELEVLSQERIDEHVETTFDLDEDFETEFIKVDDLQNLLVPKQEEMKVSKMWHDVIVQNKEDGHSLRWTLNYIDNLNVNDVDSFAKAWIAYPNIEVEEEQKYFAKIKGHEKIDSDDKYWNYCIMDESLEIADNKVHADVLTEYILNTTKDEWENLGINDDNADFVKVEEEEE